VFPLNPSDYALILDFALAIALAVYFSLGRPRVWYRDRLGWVIFSYAIATIFFSGLIVYGIVFGQKVDEPFRLVVALGLAAALVAKLRAIHNERARGRMPGTRPYSTDTEGIPTMTNLDPKDYQNGERVSLVAGETVPSSSEKVTLGPAKAIVATIATAVSMGLGALGVALADEVVTSGEWVAVAIAFLAGTGLVGGATYAARTSVTGN
jgi:hypothetical protein